MNKIVRASFKGCTIEQRKIFYKSHCIVPISVDQSLLHEGNKFQATMQLLTKKFSKCTILLDDTVQRYTLKIRGNNTISLDDLYYLALRKGDSWLDRNFKHLEPYTNVEIVRWDKWLFDNRFQYQLEIIEWFYNNDNFYRNSIDRNIIEFLTRNNYHLEELPKDAFLLCKSYLQEECAAMVLWAKEGYNFEVYPTGRNKAMHATFDLLIKPYYPNTLEPVALRFKKFNTTKI